MLKKLNPKSKRRSCEVYAATECGSNVSHILRVDTPHKQALIVGMKKTVAEVNEINEFTAWCEEKKREIENW